MRLIDADVMVRDLKKLSAKQSKRYGQDDISVTLTNAIISDIEAIPTADPQRIEGRWIDRGKDRILRWECSNCGREDTHIYTYCPDCGVRMRNNKGEWN